MDIIEKISSKQLNLWFTKKSEMVISYIRFSIVAVTNHDRLRGLKHYKCIILQFVGQKSNICLHRLKLRC